MVKNWFRNRSTIEYLGEWEALYNPDFNYTEFGIIRNAAGSNNFVLSVKQWIAATNAIGINLRQVDMAVLILIKIWLFNLECGSAQNFNCF